MNESERKQVLERIESIESELKQIRQRNERVEIDKAWESSHYRVVLLVGLIYLVSSVVFSIIDAPTPFLSALIPTIGYYFSTLSLPMVKKRWSQRSKSSSRSSSSGQ